LAVVLELDDVGTGAEADGAEWHAGGCSGEGYEGFAGERAWGCGAGDVEEWGVGLGAADISFGDEEPGYRGDGLLLLLLEGRGVRLLLLLLL